MKVMKKYNEIASVSGCVRVCPGRTRTPFADFWCPGVSWQPGHGVNLA